MLKFIIDYVHATDDINEESICTITRENPRLCIGNEEGAVILFHPKEHLPTPQQLSLLSYPSLSRAAKDLITKDEFYDATLSSTKVCNSNQIMAIGLNSPV